MIVSEFEVTVTTHELLNIADTSGLINRNFSLNRLEECIIIKDNFLFIDKVNAERIDDFPIERISQILADYLRKKLLDIGAKFSFETVFFHESKVDIFGLISESFEIYLHVYTQH